MRRWLLAAALLTLASAGSAIAEELDREAGAQLYAAFECAGCHEYEAVPGFELVQLAELGARYSDASLAALLENPPREMPIFPMSDAQREAIARYLRDRFP